MMLTRDPSPHCQTHCPSQEPLRVPGKRPVPVREKSSGIDSYIPPIKSFHETFRNHEPDTVRRLVGTHCDGVPRLKIRGVVFFVC